MNLNLIWISLLFTMFNLPNPDIGRWPGLGGSNPPATGQPAPERPVPARCTIPRGGCL